MLYVVLSQYLYFQDVILFLLYVIQMRSVRSLLVALVCKLQTVTEIMCPHTGIHIVP